MNTISKGDKFENEVFTSLSCELNNERLGILPSSAKAYQKKGYYSRDREQEIIVDISIEIWPPNADEYSFLLICECKHYRKNIPVDDVEEFKAKLDQIGGKNIKGIFATRDGFSSGAYTYAKNNGIALVRILPDDQVEWMMHLMNSETTNLKLDSNDFKSALLDQGFKGRNRRFYSTNDQYIFGDWLSVLHHTLKKSAKQLSGDNS